jgi:hypothetical protein
VYSLYITSRTDDLLSMETCETKWTQVHEVTRFHRQYAGVRKTRVQPVLRDELAVVASISAYPRERLRFTGPLRVPGCGFVSATGQ